MKVIFYSFSILFIPVAFTACNSHATASAEAKPPVCITDSMRNLVTIDSVKESSPANELKLSGEVSFNENKVVKVFPISSGQVISTQASLGDYVHAGQTLAIIKSADVASNYADLSTATTDISMAKRQMENAEHLYKNGIGSEKDFLEAKETYQKAQTNAGKIKSAIAINGSGHTSANGTYTISAPKSGFVVEKNLNPGQFIRNDNGQTLFTIGDTKDVWIWANVYESDIAKVKEGNTALVSTLAYPDTVFTGRIDKVSQILDPQTKVMRIRIVLPNNNGELKPEMFANITVQSKESSKALSIPSSAIISENGKTFVVLYQTACSLSVKEVEVAKTTGNTVFIKSGLSLNDKVISNQALLFYRQLAEE